MCQFVSLDVPLVPLVVPIVPLVVPLVIFVLVVPPSLVWLCIIVLTVLVSSAVSFM